MPKRVQVDSRGLPVGMDPLKFYEYRTLERANKADGIEAFLYRLMGPDNIRSFAIAIDPFYKIRVSTKPVMPAERKRYRGQISVLDQGTWSYDTSAWIDSSEHNYLGSPGFIGPIVHNPPAVTHLGGASFKQPSFLDYSIDTVRGKRPTGAEYGEFELFKSAVYSSGRSVNYNSTEIRRYDVAFPPPSFQNEWYNRYSRKEGVSNFRSAIFERPNYDLTLKNEKAYASALMQEHVLSMYKGLNPSRRGYSFFRSLVELRDLPRSILDLRKNLQNLMEFEKLLTSGKLKERIFSLNEVVSDIPQIYVGYHFGWKQLYSDISQLLRYPAAASKRFNFMIRRAGKATTLRSKRTFRTSTPGVPGFKYDTFPAVEIGPTSSTRLSREAELRMVINTTFDFPPLDVPRLREKLFLDYLGVQPTPTDLYNLVPWSWLLDWFTGFGDYIQAIENNLRDSSIVNYGFLTYESHGQVITDYTSQSERYRSYQDPSGITSSTIRVRNNHTSVFEYSYHLRKDIGNVFDVARISDTSSLNPYQNSILLSLLLQRDRIFSRRSW